MPPRPSGRGGGGPRLRRALNAGRSGCRIHGVVAHPSAVADERAPIRRESISVARARGAVLEVSARVLGPSTFVRNVRTSARAAKSPVGWVRVFVHDSSERVLSASNLVFGVSAAVLTVSRSVRRVVTAVWTLKSAVLKVMTSDWDLVLADQDGHDLRLGRRTRRSGCARPPIGASYSPIRMRTTSDWDLVLADQDAHDLRLGPRTPRS